jgi:CubicO group peptidase (beta-lactamase class C family)
VTGVSDVKGFVAPGFERVAERLGAGATLTLGDRERRADLGEGGGAFCAFADGECVVDVWTGPAGPAGRAWGEDTRAVIMSSTKGLTSLCAHILEDRGELDLDAPVTRYWPEFGEAGKSATTVRHRGARRRPAVVVGWLRLE